MSSECASDRMRKKDQKSFVTLKICDLGIIRLIRQKKIRDSKH